MKLKDGFRVVQDKKNEIIGNMNEDFAEIE